MNNGDIQTATQRYFEDFGGEYEMAKVMVMSMETKEAEDVARVMDDMCEKINDKEWVKVQVIDNTHTFQFQSNCNSNSNNTTSGSNHNDEYNKKTRFMHKSKYEEKSSSDSNQESLPCFELQLPKHASLKEIGMLLEEFSLSIEYLRFQTGFFVFFFVAVGRSLIEEPESIEELFVISVNCIVIVFVILLSNFVCHFFVTYQRVILTVCIVCNVIQL